MGINDNGFHLGVTAERKGLQAFVSLGGWVTDKQNETRIWR